MNVKALIFLLFLAGVSGLKVLVIYPMPIRSLNILGVGYVRHLLKAGHEVTYVSSFPLKENPPNFTHIDLSSTNLNAIEEDDSLNVGYLISKPLNEDGEVEYLQANSAEVADITFQNKELLAVLNDPSITFDVIICDYIESEVYAGLAAYYDCPMVWAYSLGSHWPTLRLIDEATNPAFAFDYLTPELPPIHSMYHRLRKLRAQIEWYFYKWYKTLPWEKSIYEKVFTPLFAKKNKPLPDYNELIYNASLVLSNDFIGNGPITSVPQNFRFIGGYHIESNIKSLPKDLKTVVDNAEHGFIFFSMGSLWRGKDIPKHITQGLLDTFSKLKQIVIWKYEEDLPNRPKNVHIVEWAPQQSLLAHPKCLFFISHGGLLSTIEAAHFGVPTIGVPLYFDQYINVNRAVESGRSIKVDLTLNLVEDLKVAIQKMLQDPTYKQKATEVTEIYHHRPIPPGAELVHWVEHVVRTRGAPHLRSPASLMPWWEKLYIDVLIIALAIVFALVHISKKFLCSKNCTVSKPKKTN